MDLETRKQRAGLMRGREARVVGGGAFEMRDVADGTDGVSFRGYASVTEVPYDMGWYTETIKRGAFGQTLANQPDVQLLINHAGEPLARTTIKSGLGSLRLNEDEIGLFVDATLNPDDPDVQRLRMKASMGLIDQMSFAFSGARSVWDDDFTQRGIEALDIHRGDVSGVNQGASPTTSFAMRAALEPFIICDHTDEALAELRELFGPDELQAALATLERLAPAQQEEIVARRHDLRYFRALVS